MVEYVEEHLDRVFGAVSHPVRREMLRLLAPRPTRVTDVARPFAISLAAASKHIRVLEEAGLVGRRVRGREHVLALEAGPLETAAEWLEHYRRFWEQRLDLLEARLLDRETM